ncbi:MAG: Flp pilus assembly complex ATPase component TadA [Sedimentisphaerales bacterium]|nr:Flp pilus assembly complex ATPase component TadA [Sedimentisphaerales bacterium]
MAKKRRKLGEILYKNGLIDKDNLVKALKASQEKKQSIGQTLIELGLVSEDNISKAVAHQFGLEYVNLDRHPVSQSTLKLIPEDIIQKYTVLPMSKENGRLKLIISNPQDLDTLDILRFRLNSEIDPVIASPSKIRAFIDRKMDDVRSSIDATAAELAEEGHTLEEEILRAEAAESDDEGPIIRLVNLLIDEAVRTRVSDIHIEPMADRVRIRYRIDGVCVEQDDIPKHMQASVMTRMKILSGMDISEKRLPQDGRIQREVDGSKIDFRVSALPGYHGESVVLRILKPESINVGIQALGLSEDDHNKFLRIIKRPNGIFLVTGPTGSGKSTTLYSALKELNKPDKKIITAEDPVEYNVTGINQCQVREEIELTFAKILRAMLRQAPNVVLVGEIRDGEVADIAIQAALTGHLVFSTLHTNDAPSAITRLIDMGVKPFLVASSIQAIMAQRLVRTICSGCKVVDEHPDPKLLKLLDIKPDDLKNNKIYKGAGCTKCNNTGYKGRRGIFEILEMNNELRDLAFARSSAGVLRRAALASGMNGLLEDGKLKIFRGITTPEEVARHAQAEA